MSVASDRLALYLTAEASILRGQEVRMDLGDGRGYRALVQADLATVVATIKDLQAQIAAEGRTGGFGFALADLSGTKVR